MATPKFNSKSPTIKRILREAAELANSPSPDFHAAPATDADLFHWHFTLRGPPNSPFASGIYHGRIVLPPTYPLRPPSFRFLTPSGRFEVNREICLSISGHHEETWQPAWGIRTALTALRTFMETDAKGQLGGLECSAQERERMAAASPSMKCGVCGRSNEEILKECEEAAKLKEKEGQAAVSVEVPKELTMEWKDEMTKKGEDTEAELAEGFVKTGNTREGDVRVASTSNTYPPARPAQSVPQPTASAQPIRVQAPAYPTSRVVQQSNDGVPLWIDRTIAAIVICLIAMVLKVLLGL